MESNLSMTDRVVRGVMGGIVIVGALVFTRGAATVLLCLLGALLLFSAMVGFCHVYRFFGVCTLRRC